MKKITFFCLLLILLLSSTSAPNTSKHLANDEDLKPPNMEDPIDNYPIEDFIV